MTEISAEQRLENRVRELGEDRGRMSIMIEDDLILLRDFWRTFLELFGSFPERVDLLNSCSPWFAWTLQRVLLREIHLAIRRLTDPKVSKMKGAVLKNVSIWWLPEFLPEPGSDAKLNSLIDDAVAKSKFARTFSDKIAAHPDMEARRGGIVVAAGTKAEIEQSILAIDRCVKRMGEVRFNVSLGSLLLPGADDTVAMLVALHRGRQEGDRIERQSREVAREKGWMTAQEMASLPEWLTKRIDWDSAF